MKNSGRDILMCLYKKPFNVEVSLREESNFDSAPAHIYAKPDIFINGIHEYILQGAFGDVLKELDQKDEEILELKNKIRKLKEVLE